MELSKFTKSNFYKYIRNIFFFSFLKKLFFKLNPYLAKKIQNELQFLNLKEDNSFLKDSKGVIHIGAHLGEERYLYDYYSNNVLWFEPIPSIYDELNKNLKNFPNQLAFNKLITDIDKKKYDFHITNNYCSSSIYEIKLHEILWPEVKEINKITLKSITLDSFIYEKKIQINKYDTIVMDTQGSELLVLKGAEKILKNIKFIKTEAADFESYEGCCQLKDIDDFLLKRGFTLISKKNLMTGEVGNYYDVVYIKQEKK